MAAGLIWLRLRRTSAIGLSSPNQSSWTQILTSAGANRFSQRQLSTGQVCLGTHNTARLFWRAFETQRLNHSFLTGGLGQHLPLLFIAGLAMPRRQIRHDGFSLICR